MIRFIADEVQEVPTARIQAIKAVREVRVLLRDLDTTLTRARDQVDVLATEGGKFVIGQTEDDDLARRVPPILAASGLAWHVENEAGESALPELEKPAEPTETPVPSYESANVALILMAVSNGNIGTAISAAQAIGRTLAEDGAKGHPFWNEVLKCLLDSFPLKGPGVHEDVQALGARLRSGGFE